MVILECKEIMKKFGGLVALEGVSLSVEKGEILGLIGPNGAGKTTLFNVIAGLYKPTSGEVWFKGKRITGLPPYRICREGVARTFQQPQPFNGLTVLENVKVGYYFGRSKNTKLNILSQVINFLDLSAKKDTLIENLNIAELRRVEIAKALATNPELLLLDEAAAGLNPAEQDELVEIVKKIRDELKITIIIVEHIMRTVMGISDKIVVLHNGRILKQGDPVAVSKDPQVIKAYLGEEYSVHIGG